MTIRVLVIDDSATMRAILMSRLAKESDISVIATAGTAAEGRELIKRFDPDVVTLDIEMPGMNGLDFLEKIMQLRPTPVIVVSGATQAGCDLTARALALGAFDCYSKCDRSGGLPLEDNGRLADLIREAARMIPEGRIARPTALDRPARKTLPDEVRMIAIGASTGGVEALQALLGSFPADCPPTLVVQHVNARFAPAIAGSLNQSCAPEVVMAEPDMPLRRGRVYFAPGGDRHMTVGGRAGHHVRLKPGSPVMGHLPSVDVLFESVAATAGGMAVGMLLTGMGSDGARGLLAMARSGALTIAQDEATSTVFGMPRAAIALGAAGIVAPIDRMARHAFAKGSLTR